MYRMAMMSFVLGSEFQPALKDRMIKMALVHDLAEAMVGDITPHCGVSKEEKFRLEAEAIEKICTGILCGSNSGREIRELWQEYEQGTSECAQFVKEIDKLEMILQALEYERQHGMRLDSFFESTKNSFTSPVMQSWAARVREMRPQLERSEGP